ncbi:transposase [Brevibacterium marinum]|nr:transposase [Brevibacterium marinum]
MSSRRGSKPHGRRYRGTLSGRAGAWCLSFQACLRTSQIRCHQTLHQSLDRAYPGQQLHLIMDNYATHKTPEVRAWLEEHPRFHVHFTPTSGSWLNLVEVWFGIIDRQAIKRGVFTSVKDLNKKIREFITGWNKRKHPFVWTKTPEQVLAKAKPKRTSETRH